MMSCKVEAPWLDRVRQSEGDTVAVSEPAAHGHRGSVEPILVEAVKRCSRAAGVVLRNHFSK